VALEQLGHEVEHSLPSHAEGKNECSYTATSRYAFRLWTGTTFHLFLINI